MGQRGVEVGELGGGEEDLVGGRGHGWIALVWGRAGYEELEIMIVSGVCMFVVAC